MVKCCVTALAFLMPLSVAGRVWAQACGGSTRTILLEYPVNSKKPVSVEYELFYLMPKVDLNGDWRKQVAFISSFIYGDPKAKDSPFWTRYDDGLTFFEVPKAKAKSYLKNYKIEDFKYLYNNHWLKYHLSELKGKFVDGKLELHTLETDGTTFLMKVTSTGYQTQYLLNDFLGGCHYNYQVRNGAPPAQKIVMKKTAKP